MQRAHLLFALDASSRKVVRRVLQGSEEAQSTTQRQRENPQARQAADARQHDAAKELHPHHIMRDAVGWNAGQKTK
jgi:hypothetical protein